MEIRTFNQKDNEAIAIVFDTCRQDEFYSERGSFEIIKWFEEPNIQSIIPETEILVCEIDSQVVAFCGWGNNEIYWLFVLTKFRKRKIAEKLLRHTLSKLKGEVTLTVWTSNERAKSLYLKLGFKIKMTKTIDYYGQLIDQDIMSIYL